MPALGFGAKRLPGQVKPVFAIRRKKIIPKREAQKGLMKMFALLVRAACVVAFAVSMVACGGGGGGDGGSTDPQPQVPLNPTVNSLETTVASGPAAFTNQSRAQFSFSASDPAATFAVRVDDGAVITTAATFSLDNLSEGAHRIAVSAALAGVLDETPATWQWTLDTTAPTSKFSSKPDALAVTTAATFVIDASEPDVHFEARVDAKDFAAVENPIALTDLAQGSHTLEVRAIDAAGNVEAQSLAYSWVVDSIAPEITLTAVPAAKTSAKNAQFEIASTEATAKLEGSLDGGDWQSIASPWVLSNLVDGPHRVSVRATDAAGNGDATPAEFAWLVDTHAPLATLIFPAASSLTDANTVTVVGRSSDATAIAQLSVSGVPAVSDDGFLTWRATVPVREGNNPLVVAVQDQLGNSDAAAASVTIKGTPNLLEDPREIVLDNDNDRAFVIDNERIVAVDLKTNVRSVLVDAVTGSGVVLKRPRDLAINHKQNRLLVCDSELSAVVAIDLVSKARTILFDGNTVTGVVIQNPSRIAVDDAAGIAYVYDGTANAVYAVDFATLTPVMIASSNVGSGVMFGSLSKMVLPRNDRLFLADPGVLGTSAAARIIYLDLRTGNRSVVSGHSDVNTSVGVGPELNLISTLAVDVATQTLWTLDPWDEYVVKIDGKTGNREIIATVAPHQTLLSPIALVFDPARKRLLITDDAASTIFSLDVATGVVSRALDDGVGAGGAFYGIKDIAYDNLRQRIISLANDPVQLVLVDVKTGARSVQKIGVDAATLLASTTGLAYDEQQDRAYFHGYVDGVAATYSYDLASATLTPLISSYDGLRSQGYSAQPDPVIALDRAANAAYVAIPYAKLDELTGGVTDFNTLWRMQPLGASNTLSEFSGVLAGSGPALQAQNIVDLDVAGSRLYALEDAGRILVVDDQGVRSVLSNGAQSSQGPSFDGPARLAIDDTKAVAYVLGGTFAKDRSAFGVIFRVDLTGDKAGTRTLVANGAVGKGPRQYWNFVARDASSGNLIIYDWFLHALLLLDPVSGDRVIVSR